MVDTSTPITNYFENPEWQKRVECVKDLIKDLDLIPVGAPAREPAQMFKLQLEQFDTHAPRFCESACYFFDDDPQTKKLNSRLTCEGLNSLQVECQSFLDSNIQDLKQPIQKLTEITFSLAEDILDCDGLEAYKASQISISTQPIESVLTDSQLLSVPDGQTDLDLCLKLSIMKEMRAKDLFSAAEDLVSSIEEIDPIISGLVINIRAQPTRYPALLQAAVALLKKSLGKLNEPLEGVKKSPENYLCSVSDMKEALTQIENWRADTVDWDVRKPNAQFIDLNSEYADKAINSLVKDVQPCLKVLLNSLN